MIFRLLVTGSRYATVTDHYDIIEEAVWGAAAIHAGPLDQILVVHGDAPGADRIAAKAARAYRQVNSERWLRPEKHPADWHGKGLSAGPIRNREMVAAGADFCLAFPLLGEDNIGTNNCLKMIGEAGLPCKVVMLPNKKT